MAIEIGTTDVTKIEIGTTNVKDVRIGSGSPIYINIYDNGSTSYGITTGYSLGTDGSASQLSNDLYLAAGYSGLNTTTNERTYRTSDLVDLTNIKTIYANISDAGVRGLGTSNNYYLVVSTSATGSSGTFNARASLSVGLITEPTTLSLNVSALTGSYYIRIHVRDGSTNINQGSSVWTRRIWGI